MSTREQLIDQLLIVRFRAGDESAFVSLVERYDGRLRYFVRRLLGSCADVDDVLQEVWFIVIRHIARLRNTKAFTAWVYRIARTQVYKEMKKRRRFSQLSDEEEVALTDQTYDENEFRMESAARIHACLEELRPEHKEVLVLGFLEGMRYQDMAHVVGCNLGTVKSRVHYAKIALRRKLEKMDK
jgi:RNA polymerase sigma-70 factor (ECF subfamily)